MIDLHANAPEGFREKPRSFPEISRVHPLHPSVASLWRWALRGVRGHRMDSFVYVGRRYTTIEAVDSFAALLSRLRSGNGPRADHRRREEMERAAERAKAIY